jgi:hypothetical protein
MKPNNFHFVLLSTTLLCVGAAARAADSTDVQSQTITADGGAKKLEQSWHVANDVRVEVGNVRGSVRVTGWDQGQVSLSGSLGEGSKLEISGDALHLAVRVEGNSGNHWFGGNGPDRDSDLVLSVPRDAALKVGVVSADASVIGVAGKTFSVDGVSGKLTLDSDAPQVEVNCVSGDVVFTTSKANVDARVNLQTVSGDISAKGLGGRVKLETVSGNIGMAGGVVQELETGTVSGDARIQATPAAHARMTLKSMSGDIHLVLPAALSAHVEAQTFSGGIHSDFGKVQNKERGPGSSLDGSVGDSDATIHAESFSGSIEFRKD